MGERSLPPKVEGYPQGRLDLIFGKPAVFPPPQPSQSFIFTFRWWGDIRPCILRLPPEKSETRITHMVTCSAQSFRQYLSDMRNLHVTVKIGGEGRSYTQDNQDNFDLHTQSPRRMEGDTPRQRLLRRQQRLKKGWQDGDVVGSFVLQDLKLNARGDYVNEGRILDSSGDMIGSVVVTMVFLEGTLEEFQQIKIQSEEVVSPQPSSTTSSPEKMDSGAGRSRLSGIPVPESRLGKPLKTPTPEGFRPRSWSFRETIKQKCDKLKSPKKQHLLQQQQQQQHSFEMPVGEKENQAPYRKRASSFTKSSGREGSAPQESTNMRKSSTQESNLQQPGHTQAAQDTEAARRQDPSHGRTQDGRDMEVGKSPQLPHRAIPQKVPPKSPQVVESSVPVVRRERKAQEGVSERARPASWGLYPLLNGADPHSLVDSGAVRADELPILLQVLEGHSPNIDFSNFDPKTRKLLDGLDLSLSSGGASGSSPQRFTFDTRGSENRGHAFSVFNKGGQKDKGDPSGVTVSGVWPLEDPKPGHAERTSHLPPTVVPKKVLASEKAKFDSPKKSLPVQSKIPMTQGGRIPVKAQRSLSSHAAPEKKLFSMPDASSQPREDEETWMEVEKTAPEKYPSDEGSLLVVDVGTLTLSSPLLPPTPPEIRKKVTGVHVLHRSRVCYLTTLDLSLPELDPPFEWDLSQTCASRQLVDHEVHYNVREALKLPPAPVATILKGHLIIRCVCRRLGERENEEVGSSSISLLDLWQLNGSEVQVPLFSSAPYGSLTRRFGRRARKMEDEDKPQSFAHITLTANLILASGQGREREQGGAPKSESRQRSESHMHAWNGAAGQVSLKPREDNLYHKKFTDVNSLFTSMDSSSGSDMSEPKLSLAESRQLSQYSKPKILTPSYPKCQESPEFNSIYLPTHLSPSEKVRRGTVHYTGAQGVTGAGENITGPQYSPRLAPSMEPGYQGYHSSFLSVISEYNGSNNQPVESGGESPCITTATDYCADFIDYNTLGWQAGAEPRREDHRGCCRVHMEILKGRNLPWIEGSEGIPQPPNCYVRTNVGSLIVLTNICRESVNPMWNFAADVLLPYSQLAQTNGSLILKVHHSQTHQRTSPDDLLLGFVSVDATSIWSGHVSLCGWYPLLDLRGAVRGHVKVSLTPHEPPLNVAVSNVRQPVHPHSVASYGPPVNQHLARHSPYPQCSGPMPDPHAEALYFQGDGACNSVLNALARPSGAVPQFTTKSQREIYNQSLQGIKDSSSSAEVNGTLEPLAAEPSGPYKSTPGSEKGEDFTHDKREECPTAHPKANNVGDKSQNAIRKSSSIPVFASSKTMLKSPRVDDKAKMHSYLPKVDYKDKENIHPTEVISQGYCRHKGSIIVKGLSKEPVGHDPPHPDTEPKSSTNGHSTLQNGEREGRKESTLIKDSLIVSHFRIQKEKEERPEEVNGKGAHSARPGPSSKGVMSSSGSDNSQSDSQHSTSDSRSSSQSGSKPSSCLKAPGSPSLRVKHVTFAHKLVQHQNGNTKLQSHFSQGEVSWRSHQSSQSLPLTRQDAISPRDLRSGHSLNLEGSDLQVVPCREGDPQAHTGAQGGVTLNGYGMSTPHDRAKDDLIMQFSWMNQNDGCDTPCVSFIESKPPMQHNNEANGTCSSKSPPDDRTAAPSPSSSTSPKKSRKLRSRIAANFTLK